MRGGTFACMCFRLLTGRDLLGICCPQALAVEKLGPDCAHWLATGKMKRGMFGIDWKGLAPKVLLAGVPVLLAVLISKKM